MRNLYEIYGVKRGQINGKKSPKFQIIIILHIALADIIRFTP